MIHFNPNHLIYLVLTCFAIPLSGCGLEDAEIENTGRRNRDLGFSFQDTNPVVGDGLAGRISLNLEEQVDSSEELLAQTPARFDVETDLLDQDMLHSDGRTIRLGEPINTKIETDSIQEVVPTKSRKSRPRNNANNEFRLPASY